MLEILITCLAVASYVVLIVCSVLCINHYTGLSSYKQDLYLASFLISVILLNAIFPFKNLSFLIVPMVVYISMELLNYGIYYTTIFDNKWLSNFFKGFSCIFFILVACTNSPLFAIFIIIVYAILLFVYAVVSRLNRLVFFAIALFFMVAISFIINAFVNLENICTSLYISNGLLIVLNVISLLIFLIRQHDYHSIVHNLD